MKLWGGSSSASTRPSSFQHQNVFSRIPKLSRGKNTLSQENIRQDKTVCSVRKTEPLVFFVFAFVDFRAWNAAVSVDGGWRKLVYRQSPSMPSDCLEKIDINKSVIYVFVKMKHIFLQELLYFCGTLQLQIT